MRELCSDDGRGGHGGPQGSHHQQPRNVGTEQSQPDTSGLPGHLRAHRPRHLLRARHVRRSRRSRFDVLRFCLHIPVSAGLLHMGVTVPRSGLG